MPAAQLRPNPRNWRRHPTAQQDALRAILAEVGYADALLARETEAGDLMLIDGHLRAETTPDMEVPVLILDVDADEADKLLALHDPIGHLAETDAAVLAELIETVDTQNAALQKVLDELVSAEKLPLPIPEPAVADVEIPATFQVIVECQSEPEQRTVYERLTADGYTCRVITL